MEMSLEEIESGFNSQLVKGGTQYVHASRAVLPIRSLGAYIRWGLGSQ